MAVALKNRMKSAIDPLNASVALIETSQSIFCANQLTGFYMMATLVPNGLSFP